MAETGRTKIEDKLGDGKVVVPLRYEISSYGADIDVEGLVRRLDRDDIVVPEFQRGFVWRRTQASRFIESLLLGLPVPGIFLSTDFDTQRLVVIDGQQRLRTLQYFYQGAFADTGRVFSLSGVQQQFDGKTYSSLRDEDRRRLDNSVLHVTIVRQETPPEDDSSIYFIFERLNTTGTPLLPQEIRHCIYQGEFDHLLSHLNGYPPWRSVYGKVDLRMRDQELILRFLALYGASTQYRSPMKDFLNRYMATYRKLDAPAAGGFAEVFKTSISWIDKTLGHGAFRPVRSLNAAVFDSVMVGTARRLDKGPITEPRAYEEQYRWLLGQGQYEDSTSSGTSQVANVRSRLELATRAFTDLR